LQKEGGVSEEVSTMSINGKVASGTSVNMNSKWERRAIKLFGTPPSSHLYQCIHPRRLSMPQDAEAKTTPHN
jgi:hypothetical protein